jgi:hypothetical protein
VFAAQPGNRGQSSAGRSEFAQPFAAAVATICASTAISGVVGGFAWLTYIVVAVAVIFLTGITLRALRIPPAVLWVGQAFVLLCLLVTLFTNTGLLVVLPGPAALHDLGVVLSQAGSDVQTGVPPVLADQPIVCLIVLAVGAVAVAVDLLAVTARVPAAAGLILLCVYAVPASLDDQMLPWWSFVLGAGAFTILLAVDGVRRHQAWRGQLGLPTVASAGVAPATTAVTAMALAVALFIGATFTAIGTVGRLPGTGNGNAGTGQLGIKPFTVLQGMLDHKATVELFDVQGLPQQPPYLRALTLSTYLPGQGFVPDTQMAVGVPADGPLPPAPGESGTGQVTSIDINAVNWDDVWLPVFGDPSLLTGISSDFHYDRETGIVYTEQNRRPGHYSEQTELSEPSATQLRAASGDFRQIDPKYRTLPVINPRVSALAKAITSGQTTEFDKTRAIYTYFRDASSGFTYSTQTANAVTGDPLVDFLFYGKTGFCEQYSTAMAVLLRTLGIPVRVAIGFTDGYQSGSRRTITSQDAHAWDEVYFPGYGWTTFDPTPLTDGRSRTPDYLNPTAGAGAANKAGQKNIDKADGGDSTPKPKATATNQNARGSAVNSGTPAWLWWIVGIFGVVGAAIAWLLSPAGRRKTVGKIPLDQRTLSIAGICWGLFVFFTAALLSWWFAVLLLVIGLSAAPAVVREVRRRHHHRLVAGHDPHAADAAWTELLAESWDRGMSIERSATLRVAAQRMVREHGLDDEGREGLRTLVGAVERSWYRGGAHGTHTSVVRDSFESVRRSLHRNAPLPWPAKLLPKSVLRPGKPAKNEPVSNDDTRS